MASAPVSLNIVTFNMNSPPVLKENESRAQGRNYLDTHAISGATACHVIRAEGEKGPKETRVLLGPLNNKKEFCLTEDLEKTQRVTDYVIETLAKIQDVVCLQEVNPEYKEILAKKCIEQNLGFHFRMIEGNNHGTAIIYDREKLSHVIASEYQIYEENEHHAKTGKSRLVTVIDACTASGTAVRIASAHFFGFASKEADERAVLHIMNARKAFSVMTFAERFFWLISLGFWQPKPVTIIGADTNLKKEEFNQNQTPGYHRVDVQEGHIGGLFVDTETQVEPGSPQPRKKKPDSKSVCALLVSSFLSQNPLQAQNPEELGFDEKANLSDHSPVAASIPIE